MTHRRVALIVALVAACAKPQPPAQPQPQPPPPRSGRTEARAPNPRLLDRVAVLGASVSAGFASPRIAVAMHEAMREPRDILDVASVWMFRDVYTDGARQVDAATAHAPTLTVALDFLFWYAYRPTDAAERTASLERGLAELARLPPGPLALGDLPDMRGANENILSPAAVPPRDELVHLNARIHAWAAARPDTAVLPLGAWSQDLAADDGRLFIDRLHVNALGLAWLMARIDEALEQELGAEADGLRFTR